MYKIKTHHILFIITFILYLLLSNKDQGFDSYSYAINIRAGVDLFHPHHLLYGYFANLIYRLFSFTGIDCLRLISIVNSFLAANTICLIFLLLKGRHNFYSALFGSLTIALLYSFWYYATSLEVNLPALLFMILSLYWFLAKPDSRAKYYLVFLYMAIGVLFHQIVILAFIPFTLYLLFRKVSLKQLFLYLLPSIILVTGLYLLVGFSQIEHKTIGDFYYWLTFYSHLGQWGKLSIANFITGCWGIIKTYFGGETIREIIYGDKRNISTYAYILMIIIFVAIYILNIISSIRSGIKKASPVARLLLALIIVFAIFAFWWAPTDDGFWLYSIVILTITIFYLNEKTLRLGIVGLVLLVALNIPFEIAPAASENNSIAIQGSRAFNRLKLTTNDIVFTNLIQIRLAYQYYHNIETPTASLVYSDVKNREEAAAHIRQLLDKASLIGRIYVFENELNPEPHRRFLFERFTSHDYLQIYKPFYPYLTTIDSFPAYGKTVRIYQLVGLDTLKLDSLAGN